MVLSLNDIAAFVANWRPKAENLRLIQQQLDLGLDSLVFLDDQPSERAAIRQLLPAVTVPELPPDPAHFQGFLSQLNLFETPTLSEADQDRTRQYREAARREAFATEAVDTSSFLASLQMQAQIGPFQAADLPRLAQLTQRTNQFHLRGGRYTEAQLQPYLQAPAPQALQVRLTDRFGAYGLVSLLLLRPLDQRRLFIEQWCMSCRVFQRGLEACMLNHLVTAARAAGFAELWGEFIPSGKNEPVRDLFSRLGFAPVEEGQWKLTLEDFSPLPHHIQPGELRS